MLTKQTVTVLGVALLAWVISTDSAPGQSASRFQPSSPTLSPWLNLYQDSQGPLDNYHSYVRPQMELRDTLSQQRTINQTTSQDLRTLRDSAAGPSKDPRVRATGTRAGYMSYSHYYYRDISPPEGGSSGRHAWSPPPATTRPPGGF